MNATEITFKFFYSDCMPILIKLSKRYSHDAPNDGRWTEDTKDIRGYKCRICNQNFINSKLMEHGFQHLKEHNLLPFI